MNSFFVPQLGSQIYTMAGMVTRLHLQADHPGTYRGLSAQYQRRRFCRYALHRRRGAGRETSRSGSTRRASAGPVLDAQSLRRSGQAEQGGCAFHLSCRRSRPVQRHLERRNAADRSIATHPSGVTEGREMNLLGKLSWSAIPFDQPIVMGASAGMVLAIVLVLGWVTRQGIRGLICGASGSPPSTTSGSASCTSCWRWSCCCAASPTRS